MGLGPTQQYLAKFNGVQLPGYVQSESFDSVMNIADHPAAYIDGTLSESTGLGNKTISVVLKVWEQDYLTCKDQVQLAATILRSTRVFAPLYVQYTNKYYSAIARSIQVSKEAGSSVKTLEYNVEFEAKPWLISETTYTVSGTGTITTDQISRSISDGGWTPATVQITGTNVTVSGYSDMSGFTGFISASGAVSNLIINTEAFTATQSGVNKNGIMNNTDYRLYVGPGKTTFTIAGASSCTISYNNRWYI